MKRCIETSNEDLEILANIIKAKTRFNFVFLISYFVLWIQCLHVLSQTISRAGVLGLFLVSMVVVAIMVLVISRISTPNTCITELLYQMSLDEKRHILKSYSRRDYRYFGRNIKEVRRKAVYKCLIVGGIVLFCIALVMIALYVFYQRPITEWVNDKQTASVKEANIFRMWSKLGLCAFLWIYFRINIAFIPLTYDRVWKQYKEKFYNSTVFQGIIHCTEKLAGECSQMNAYIENMKTKHKHFVANNAATTIDVIEHDIGTWNTNRSFQNGNNTDLTVCNCSLAVYKSASNNPFKYFCKYFGVSVSDDTINQAEQMLNDFETIGQGIQILQDTAERIIAGNGTLIPECILRYDKENLLSKIHFPQISFDMEYPVYTFQYSSAGGYTGQSFDIEFNPDVLERFIAYLNQEIKRHDSADTQRKLMTRKLREFIKERDNYTCCKCGISTHDEPHLLLEIDHIKPVSKGGITEISNLQTLCWRCNRSKGAKIEVAMEAVS